MRRRHIFYTLILSFVSYRWILFSFTYLFSHYPPFMALNGLLRRPTDVRLRNYLITHSLFMWTVVYKKHPSPQQGVHPRSLYEGHNLPLWRHLFRRCRRPVTSYGGAENTGPDNAGPRLSCSLCCVISDLLFSAGLRLSAKSIIPRGPSRCCEPCVDSLLSMEDVRFVGACPIIRETPSVSITT